MSTHIDAVYVVTYYQTEMWGTRFKSEKFIKSEAYISPEKAKFALQEWSNGTSMYGNIKELKVIR